MMLSLIQLTISFGFSGAVFMVSAQMRRQGGHKKATTNLVLLGGITQYFKKKISDLFVKAPLAKYYIRNLCNFRIQLNGHENST
jgi:hypothetical protein